jgi:hypothetical protein
MNLKRLITLFSLSLIFVIASHQVDNSVSSYYPDVKRSAEIVKCGDKFMPEDAFVNGQWWPGETWGRWTREGENNISIVTKLSDFSLEISYQKVSEKTQWEVKSVTGAQFESQGEPNLMKVYIRNHKFTDLNTPLTIYFETKNAVRPFDVDKNNPDFRKLGVGVKEIIILCSS